MELLTETEKTLYSQAATAVVRALDGYRGHQCVFNITAGGMPNVTVYDGENIVSRVASDNARWLYSTALFEMRLNRHRRPL